MQFAIEYRARREDRSEYADEDQIERNLVLESPSLPLEVSFFNTFR